MAKKQYQLVSCTINGREVEQMVDVRASLTDMLRNDYHLTSVKKGCEVGECGACNVLIDGECFNSCLYLAVWAEGKHITTLEGLMGPNGELSDIQQAFIDETAIQCGFCTPGFILSAKALLDRGFHAPTVYFPLIVHECLMAEPTETESPETLDQAAQVFLDILAEAKADPESLHQAPRCCPVGRPDEVTAARSPILRYSFGE